MPSVLPPYRYTCEEMIPLALKQVSAMDARSRGRQDRYLRLLLVVFVANTYEVRGEDWRVPGGNKPYYAIQGIEEHLGKFPDAIVHGATRAYYRAARRRKSEVMAPARVQARMQSLDALWEGTSPGQDVSAQDNKIWIGNSIPGVPAALDPGKTRLMEHNLEHEVLAGAINDDGPAVLGTFATGSPGGKPGAGFTGVGGSVWHKSWIATSDKSIAAPSSTISDMKNGEYSTIKYSDTGKAGDRVAKQEAFALTPPGSGMRGPPPAGYRAATAATMATNPSSAGCTQNMVEECRAGCNSKLNLVMVNLDPEYTKAPGKWRKNCMSKCLGPCVASTGFPSTEAAAEIQKDMANEEKLINKLTKEFRGQVSPAAASVASSAIKRLEQKAGLGSTRLPPSPASASSRVASSVSTSNESGSDVWHGSLGLTPAPSPGKSGIRPFPASKQAKGAQSGVYDCRGSAIKVGDIVGRMVPGQACEDQYLVLTAGMWQVTDFKKPGAAEVVEMRHGASTKGRVAVTLQGIQRKVNQGMRVELVPFIGAFTHWKLVTGPTKDLFLPSNVAALKRTGRHNKAGINDPSGFTNALLTRSSTHVDKSGVSKSESVFSVESQRQNDWGKISATEKQDANLAMCPGPSCPSDGPSKTHRIMHLGNPFWKYVIVFSVLGAVLAYQYIKRLNESAVPTSILQQEYVQLPSLFSNKCESSKSQGVELESTGGSRPAQRQGSERIVFVENASDRIIMVDVGSGVSSSVPGGNGDTAIHAVGYQ